jgi:predicted methyltransferase
VRIYIFKPKIYPIFTFHTAELILNELSEGKKEIYVSLDLGKTFSILRLEDNKLRFKNYECDIEEIKEIYARSDETELYAWINRSFFPLKFFKNKFYKLRNVKEGAPTLEINGIHMHRIKEINPWEDAKQKVEALNITKKDRVLDIGTGLGYTAINAYVKGPAKLITIEKELEVLKIAEFNPWSKELQKIPIVLGDAFEILDDLEKEYFNKVIHDPPTFSIGEELYSLEFYRKLYNFLPKKALVYHYIGYPSEISGLKKIRGNILSRLKKVGFAILREVNYGFLIKK